MGRGLRGTVFKGTGSTGGGGGGQRGRGRGEEGGGQDPCTHFLNVDRM